MRTLHRINLVCRWKRIPSQSMPSGMLTRWTLDAADGFINPQWIVHQRFTADDVRRFILERIEANRIIEEEERLYRL